jgi:RNase H-fold protein (predicted Holliday junction resolvase)
LYYDVLGVVHDNSEMVNFNEDYFYSKSIADKIFRVGKDGKYINEYNTKDEVPNYKTKEELGKIQAKRDCNKNYPKTVEENVHIFEEYIKMLRENNIEPIVVVFPATKYYYNYFSKRIENEFSAIIDSMRKKFNFVYLDYFKSHVFETDEDFWDVSHLNESGAQKVTKFINDYIKDMLK